MKNKKIIALIVIIVVVMIITIMTILPKKSYTPVQWAEYRVCGGDTIYSICQKLYPDRDYRIIESQIVDYNKLGRYLEPGIIYVPVFED